MSSPRERLVVTMAHQLREHGVEGTGLRPLVAAANAPWGSLRHYFPGGKDQLVSEALAWSGSFAGGLITAYLAAGPPTADGLLDVVVGWWVRDLERRDFALGCPVAATVADCAHTNATLRAAAQDALEVWRAPLQQGLRQLGLDAANADEVSIVVLSALSGAILLSRARRSTEPLRIVQRRLAPLLAPS